MLSGFEGYEESKGPNIRLPILLSSFHLNLLKLFPTKLLVLTDGQMPCLFRRGIRDLELQYGPTLD